MEKMIKEAIEILLGMYNRACRSDERRKVIEEVIAMADEVFEGEFTIHRDALEQIAEGERVENESM